MKKPIISISGLRGVVGESLDPLMAIRYVCAFASGLDPGPIVVSRDGRSTGAVFADAIASGLAATGRDILDADIAATPTLGVLVRQHQAAGGIQISASHNPREYNGIKLFGADGKVISATSGQSVIDRYENGNPDWCTYDRIGVRAPLKDSTRRHLELVMNTVDAACIREHKFKVVLDSNHGSGSVLGRQLLEALGTDHSLLGGEPNGDFAHPPEPTATNLQAVADKSVEFGANIVFCQDPDADRLAIIDESGNYIGEEYTLAITLAHRLKQQKGAVVVNCATSRMSADIAAANGCEFFLSAVGEANVTAEMLRTQAVYGGEGNGGPIDPKVGYVRDSFVAMAQLLDAMAASGKTISELAGEIPRYEICKTTIEVDSQKFEALFEALESKFPDASANRQDGLRLDWSDRWLLVRPSNTEPIVRAIAEAKDLDTAQSLCESARQLAQGV